jgi:hypothetical protein
MMSNLYHYSYKYIKSNLYHYSYKYIKSNLYHYSYKYIKSNLYHYSYKYIKSCSQYNSIYMNKTFCPNWNFFENVLLLNASIKFVFPQYIYICIPTIHLYLYSHNTSICFGLLMRCSILLTAMIFHGVHPRFIFRLFDLKFSVYCFVDRVLSFVLSWPLCCLFFFVLRLLITPLVSSNFPYLTFIHLTTQLGIHLKLHYLSCCRYFYVNDLGYKDGLSKYRSGEHFR